MGFCYYRYMLFVGLWSLGLGRPLSAQGLVSCTENLEDNAESNADNGSQLCKVPEGRKKNHHHHKQQQQKHKQIYWGYLFETLD